jgi:hippurate hydrolase
VQQVYGMHNMPGIPIGAFATRPGPLMAAADKFTILIDGKGGHGAMPHKCIDLIVVGSQIVMALQSIVSRNADPLDSAVVSTTFFRAGDTFNVIPQTLELRGTVRTLTPGMRDLCETRIRTIVEATCAMHGATAKIDYHRGYPVTVNHERQTEFAAAIARSVVGDGNVDINTPPLMGAEDFSYMLEARPGAYVFIGNGDTASVHHPAYDFNDAAIPYGVSFFAKVVETGMPA